jgi:cyanophycinase
MRLHSTLFLVLLFAWSTGIRSQTIAGGHEPAGSDQPVSRGPAKGTLLVIGGNASDIFYSKFMELIGGAEAPIVVIPTAISSDVLTPGDLENFKKSFTDRGFKQVTVLHTRDREEANSEAFVEPIRHAAGVWFSGGRQWRHADSYLDTKTHRALFELLERGGVIAGSSAGATIQGSYLARGDTRKNTIMAGDHETGLGFITHVAIDQHLLARNRQFDMFEILGKRPELLGIGLDEDTGIIVKGNRFTVFGTSYVAIYDGTRWSAERDTVYQLPPGSKEFYLLHQGEQYDMANRKIIAD